MPCIGPFDTQQGVSLPVAYALPTLSDIQGAGSTTPYPYEGMQVNTNNVLIVTRGTSATRPAKSSGSDASVKPSLRDS